MIDQKQSDDAAYFKYWVAW